MPDNFHYPPEYYAEVKKAEVERAPVEIETYLSVLQFIAQDYRVLRLLCGEFSQIRVRRGFWDVAFPVDLIDSIESKLQQGKWEIYYELAQYGRAFMSLIILQHLRKMHSLQCYKFWH
mmetsp:Transcript_9980/g.13041  ORF Transcript_9980/g.13041 Transcript_9980/m.13041 type:complete len:118 (-) Transcript_9980:266-619(-)